MSSARSLSRYELVPAATTAISVHPVDPSRLRSTLCCAAPLFASVHDTVIDEALATALGDVGALTVMDTVAVTGAVYDDTDAPMIARMR